MPDNILTPDCHHRVGRAQLFMAPSWNPEQKGVKVQIIDVFALELATGYVKDPEGRLLLSSELSLSAGRTWSKFFYNIRIFASDMPRLPDNSAINPPPFPQPLAVPFWFRYRDPVLDTYTKISLDFLAF